MKMFLRTAAVLTVCSLSLPVFGQKSVPEVYDRTVSRLDTKGLVLTYRNVAEGCTLEKEVLSILCSLAARECGEGESQSAIQVIRELIRESGLESIYAVGASVSPVSEGMFRAKSFVCTPQGRSGILADITVANRPAEEFFNLVPAEAFLAGGSNLNLAPAFDRVLEVLKKNLPEEDYAEIGGFLDEAKNKGTDIRALLASVSGFVFYVENVPGAEAEAPVPGVTDGAILLETTDDSIYRSILTSADQEDIRDGKVIVLDADSHVEVLQIGKCLVLSNNLARATDILNGKVASLAVNPKFAKYVPGEKDIQSFFLWTPELGSLAGTLASLAVPQENLSDVASLIQAFGLKAPLCSVSSVKQDGIICIALTSSPGLICALASGATGGNCASAVPVVAGALMPAIQSAREAAKRHAGDKKQAGDAAADDDDED